MENFISIIKEVDLFQGIDEKSIEALLTKEDYNIKEYRKSSVIYFQKEECLTLDIVLQGIVSIEGIDDKGSYITISDFNSGDVIGGNLLFSHNNFYPMTITAKIDVTIIRLKKGLILKLCQSNSNFLINFLSSLSDKTLILADRIKTLSFKSLRNCILDYLRCESNSQNSNKIKLRLTKKELAEKFGVERTSLSRELNKMRGEGLIEYDARSITIIK